MKLSTLALLSDVPNRDGRALEGKPPLPPLDLGTGLDRRDEPGVLAALSVSDVRPRSVEEREGLCPRI